MSRTPSARTCVVIGGGIIGCSVAWELARRSVRVIVLERSVPGAEASSAAAGILGAQVECAAPGALFELALRSRRAYAAWTAALVRATGIDVEYRPSGVMDVAFDAGALRALRRRYAFQRKLGERVVDLAARKLRERLPMLTSKLSGASFLPDDARVDPPALFRALRIAAERANVEFRSGAYVRRIALENGRVRGVGLDDGSIVSATDVVVAAGSWSALVEGAALPPGGVTPARGQMVELLLSAPLFEPVIHGPRCYLVPRDDGRVLVGSTLEFVGYRREVTARAVRDLLDAAIELVPALADAQLSRTWSSFRPYVADGLPAIGNGAEAGLVIATGHHRNGILLAPVTAEIVSALVRNRRPPLDIRAFSPRRGRG
jgi:glycine oxidase